MIVARTRAELRSAREALRARGRLGLVPTMGYLHEGHLSLVDLAAARADVVAASIFVNPIQFGPGEDFERYPRDEARDFEQLEARGTALVFAPSVEQMYPGGPPAVRVDPGALGGRLCGTWRPGHFEGVLTVVARLFGLFTPDVAVFGRKDLQQAVLITRMAADLEFDIDIVTAPISREADGLARSSRNAYLGASERAAAAGLSAGLRAGVDAFAAGERDAAALVAVARTRMAAFDGLELQYLELVTPDSLEPVASASPDDVLAVAAFVGRTRLIDNMRIGGGE